MPLAIQMTIFGSLAVVFYSVSTVTNAILQGIDKMRLPIIHALISLVLHLAALELFFYVFDLGIYSMVLRQYPVCRIHVRCSTRRQSADT